MCVNSKSGNDKLKNERENKFVLNDHLFKIKIKFFFVHFERHKDTQKKKYRICVHETILTYVFFSFLLKMNQTNEQSEQCAIKIT